MSVDFASIVPLQVPQRCLGYLLAMFLLLCAPAVHPTVLPRLVGTVSRVVDGDTIDVRLSSGPIRVRLHGIDAPERAQSWGHEATAALAALVLNRPVSLEPFQQDRYHRLVARVFLQDRDINAELIQQGDAWAYRQYMTKADARYCAFEETARAAKRGLWRLQSGDQVQPWLWRRFHKRKSRMYWIPHKPTQMQCIREIGVK